MSWLVSRKGDAYRLWSTVSDQYITDWISRDDALALWYDDALMAFKKRVIEQYIKFPNHWGDKDSRRMSIHVDKERHVQLCQWLAQLAETRTPEDYEQMIDEMYEKIVRELDEEEQS